MKTRANCFAAAVLLAGFMCFSADAEPSRGEVSERRTVSVVGLDLGRPADAEVLYVRIRSAAHSACRAHQAVWDVKRVLHQRRCAERVVGETIVRLNQPLLTAVHDAFGELLAER